MRVPGLVLGMLMLLCGFVVRAQFNYFNILTGEPDDLESQSTGNVEVVEDGYVVWGAGVDDGVLFHFVRKYDFSGNITAENELIFPGEYLYAGLVNSFRWNPHNEEFVMVQGSGMEGALRGRMLRFNQGLELIDSRYYDEYDPYTYLFGALVEDSAYVVYGEILSESNSGTYLMKMDFEGNPVWTQTMEPRVTGYIYRNRSILPLDNGGYLVAGGGSTGGGISSIDPFARITLLDSLGNTLSATDYVDPVAPKTYSDKATKLNNGDFLIGQSVGYEHDSTTTNPNVYWTKVRLHKFNTETLTFYDQHEYFDDYDFVLGGIVDMEATSDGGAIVLGGNPGNYFDNYAWLIKVDSEGVMDWHQTYSYNVCSDCSNFPADIELAPDGGYIIAGWYADYSIDPRNSTWLLKVDACGDVEWQGCEPLGTGDAVNPGERSVVYPNPAHTHIFVAPPIDKTVVSYTLYSPAGKQVGGGRSTDAGIDVSGLARGLYVLKLAFANGSVEAHKVEVVR